MHRFTEPHFFDAHEIDEFVAVFRLRQDHDRADLRDRLRENRWRQHRPAPRGVIEIALVRRDVFDADDPLVELDLGDAIDEKKRIAVRQNFFNGCVI